MIPIMELKRQYKSIQGEIDAAVRRVFESGWFILGREVEAFEKEFASYCDAAFGVGVGSGVEALHLALLACGVGPGDEVITVANTAVPTVCAITFAGAKPVFVDVCDDTLLMNPDEIESRITEKTKAILPVHLYGQTADMTRILEIARRCDLRVIEDAAQAHGAKHHGRRAGTFGDAGCFSFYPSKNLGAFGDAGMVVTSDAEIAEKIRMLRNYGQSDRYHHDIKGFNSRLDELHAAMLREKLKRLDAWNERRREIAQRYDEAFADLPLRTPVARKENVYVYHLYVVRTARRDELREFLKTREIGTQIHYPIPVHLQKAYADLGLGEGALPVTEKAAKEILSLPLYPELTDDEIEEIIQAVRDFATNNNDAQPMKP